jgi:hypothetical protein
MIPPGFTLHFGNAVVLVPGHPPDAELIDGDTQFGDGQARTLPVTLLWPDHFENLAQWCSAAVLDQIGAVGISRLLPQGNPRLPPGLDPVAWASARLAESIRRLHGKLRSVDRLRRCRSAAGPDVVGGEPLAENGAGAEQIIPQRSRPPRGPT